LAKPIADAEKLNQSRQNKKLKEYEKTKIQQKTCFKQGNHCEAEWGRNE